MASVRRVSYHWTRTSLHFFHSCHFFVVVVNGHNGHSCVATQHTVRTSHVVRTSPTYGAVRPRAWVDVRRRTHCELDFRHVRRIQRHIVGNVFIIQRLQTFSLSSRCLRVNVFFSKFALNIFQIYDNFGIFACGFGVATQR